MILVITISDGVAQQFGFGVETGLTAGRFSDNQFRRRFTYHMGVNAQTTLPSNIHLNLGLGYVRKGATSNVTGVTGPESNFNLDYLELALLAGIGGENLQFRIGPTYSLLAQASISSGIDNVNITDLISDSEFGVKAGVFYKFREGKAPYFSIYYYQGLQDTEFDPDDRLTTNYFQLSIGYLLISNN